jgi:gamma-glutamylcyclotransferase (GGCT)/AIG2-like uncharacterized protein YtfP
LLFAYGTLKDPQQLVAVVGFPVRCAVVGAGTVGGILYDVGEYPALRPSESHADLVPGVLLDVDDAALARLDAYEGVPEGLYLRQRGAVRLDDGRRVEAWVYVYNRATDGLRRIAAWPPGSIDCAERLT